MYDFMFIEYFILILNLLFFGEGLGFLVGYIWLYKNVENFIILFYVI